VYHRHIHIDKGFCVAQKDYYAILGVAPSASQEDIRSAFLQKALQHHPDRGGTHEKMVELSEAVEILADPEKRALYDQVRMAPQNEIVRNQWQRAEAQATTRAQSYPQNSADFSSWLDGIAADVQKTTGGRILTGFVAGAIFGCVGGFAVGWFMGINIFIGAGIGFLAGAVGGAFAAASNDPTPEGGRAVR
jgi:curved DNA-binding protein CbpA